MRRVFAACFLGASLFLPPEAPAQNPPSPVFSSETETPYLLPQTIFVGDQGRLVVPLDRAGAAREPFVLEAPGTLPETPELAVLRLELERRGGSARLLIDFIPYVPGLIPFPPLELPSPGREPLVVAGLQAPVASILSPSQMTLSEPVSPMAVPGTSLLVYGTAALVLALLFLGIGGSLWGRRHFKELWERFRKRRLIRAMMRFLRRLEQEGGLEKKGKPGFYLTLLSGEFREFLSLFTGVNCRSLTAGELRDLPLGYAGLPREGFPAEGETAAEISPGDAVPRGGGASPFLAPGFLRDLFRAWDTLRFSGRAVDKIDFFLALKETKNFIAALDNAEREKALPKSLWEKAPEKNENRPAGAGTGKEGADGF